ncbi:MAG: ABC-F family ATP-binding cassette domain-containing protein [Mycobacteriales bacterium]
MAGFIDVSRVSYRLPDGRLLLDNVSFRVGEGAKLALVGANGAGKTTLLRIVSGEIKPSGGSVRIDGGLGVMPQFIGSVRAPMTVAELLLTVAPPRVRRTTSAVARAERDLATNDGERNQLRYAQALSDFADAGGYEIEVLWDTCCIDALGIGLDRAGSRQVTTLSGGEQKRLVLEALVRGPDQALLLDEPDNYLDIRTKRWLESRICETPKSMLYVSHDRQVLANTATHIATVELKGRDRTTHALMAASPAETGNTVWVHPGGFVSYEASRRSHIDRLTDRRRGWDEEHVKLRTLVKTLQLAKSPKTQAAMTRLRRFEEAGTPVAVPREQRVTMRLNAGRTGKRAVVCEQLELAGLTKPFSTEVFAGERVGVLGSNGTGKSHFLRLLAAGGSSPDKEHHPVSDITVAPVAHSGIARLGARARPGWFAQTHEHPELIGRTLIGILHRGNEHRAGIPPDDAAPVLQRYELAEAAEQLFESLSGGQQARLQILLLELSGATLLLLDEPTDNLDIVSADALQAGLAAFEGAVIAVTHDRWFAGAMDRYVVFGEDGRVYESAEPVWDQAVRARR